MARRDTGHGEHAPWTVHQARRLLAGHERVARVSEPTWVAGDRRWALDTEFLVDLPGHHKSAGSSPTGVRSRETVRLAFPQSYPLDAPEISLRPAFPRDLPHIQPWLTNDGRPVPCVVDGPIAELVLSEGLLALVHQIATWLQGAAAGTLMDPEQGWEPVRRDDLKDILVADRAALLAHVDRRGGFRFLKSSYFMVCHDGLEEGSYSVVGAEVVPMNASALRSACHGQVTADGARHRGYALTLLAWPGKAAGGQPIVCGRYFPETVSSVGELRERARAYGCKAEVDKAIGALKSAAADLGSEPFPLSVVLCARRPYALIDENSAVELCSYVTRFQAPSIFPEGEKTVVRPTALRDAISRPLLARLSGLSEATPRVPWTLIGAGSVGSKVALHLGRAGQGPGVVIDDAMLNPHNVARHALVPALGAAALDWSGEKTAALACAIESLGQSTHAIPADVVDMLARKKIRQAWPKGSWAVINTTASLRVREAIAGAPTTLLPSRVIEMLLFGEGQLGVVTLEGEARNPDTADVMSELYRLALADTDLRGRLHPDAGTIRRIAVGQGCGSATMLMSDARVSLFTAGMAEYLLTAQQSAVHQAEGELLVGRLASDRLGVHWERRAVPPVIRVTPTDRRDWTVRIHEHAASKIEAEIARCPGVETGGVIMGRISEARRTFQVVDVLPAPKDSLRTATAFTLGTAGLSKAIRDYFEQSGGTLGCIGTWHSHLSPSGPSSMDRLTAAAMNVARVSPVLVLIRAPDAFHAATGLPTASDPG